MPITSENISDADSPRRGLLGTILQQLRKLFCCGNQQTSDTTRSQSQRNYDFISKASGLQDENEVIPRPKPRRRPKPDSADGTSFKDLSASYVSATHYRNEAQQHLKRRRQLRELAKMNRKTNNGLAMQYFEEAKKELKLSQQANTLAAAAFLKENRRRNPNGNTIDFHGLFVKEAIQALDNFLDDKISALRHEALQETSLIVITGRGKNSTDGIPKVKPAVIKRLNQRGLQYTETNPGALKVHIHL